MCSTCFQTRGVLYRSIVPCTFSYCDLLACLPSHWHAVIAPFPQKPENFAKVSENFSKECNFLVKVHFFSQTSENFSKVTENFSKECTFLVKHENFFLQKNASENNFSWKKITTSEMGFPEEKHIFLYYYSTVSQNFHFFAL